MKFEDVMKEMESMFPNDFIDYGFKVTVAKLIPGITYQARACVVPIEKGVVKNAVSFEAPTWRGVIDAFKIYLLPKGEGSMEEAPVQQTTPAGRAVLGPKPCFKCEHSETNILDKSCECLRCQFGAISLYKPRTASAC